MSMRPNLKLLCGITDLQRTDANHNIWDPRYDSKTNILDLWETRPPIPKEDKDGDWLDIKCGIEDIDAPGGRNNRTNDYHSKDLYDLLDFDPEFGVPSVIGYVIDDECSRSILYALASLYPQLEEAGIMMMESMPLDKDDSSGSYYLRRHLIEHGQTIDEFLLENRDIEPDYKMNLMLTKAGQIKFGQNYKSFGVSFLGYTIVAQYLFDYVGLTVAREEMKLFLHHYWA